MKRKPENLKSKIHHHQQQQQQQQEGQQCEAIHQTRVRGTS